MKDGTGAAEQGEPSRQQLLRDYEQWSLQPDAEVRPCRDDRLLRRAAQYLRRERGEPAGAFTVFPFPRAVAELREPLSRDCGKHLSAFIKATELLETLCLNLFLQPWKKEFKTLKTFTGPFVYCLLPVLSSSTIQSVLASIGYLPHADASQSEFRLGEDVDPDRAILVGFELLLARVECHHVLELLEKDQLDPQEWLDVLQRREGAAKAEEPTEKKPAAGQKEEEKKREVADRKQALHLDTTPAVNPRPKPRRRHLMSADQSIMEMQRTYPDLAFRGRPLVPDKPRPADEGRAAELPKRDSARGQVDEDGGGSGSGDRGPEGTGGTEELSGPQAISLHITLRAGPKAEQGPQPGESQPTAEPVADPSLSSVDDEEALRELAERMGQLHVRETKEEARRGGGEGDADKERRRRRRGEERKASAEGEAEEQSLGKPVMETGPAPGHDTPAAAERAEPGRGEEEQLAQSFVIVEHHKK